MEIDTGTFRALTAAVEGMNAIAADVAGIKDQLRQLHFNRLAAFAEGAAHEAERALLRAQRPPGRHARPRGERPGHLRAVGEDGES